MKNIVIITGANRGLGKAIVDLTLENPDNLIISLSRSLHESHKKFLNKNLIFKETDLASSFSDSNFQFLKKNINKYQTLYFFNNAGVIRPISRIGTLKQAEIDYSIKVNIEYPVNLINYFMRTYNMLEIRLVNITSGAGINPIAYWSLYGSAKVFMRMFCQVLEEENKGNQKLKIYNIDPGVMDTGMQSEIRNIEFPKRQYFQSLQSEDKLKEPSDSAKRILNEIDLLK